MATDVPIDQVREPYPGRERAARRAGPARHGHRRSATSIRPRSIPNADLLPLISGPPAPGPGGHRRPAATRGPRRDRQGQAAGIQVRMITGDHAVTAEAIASQLGIEGEAITGAEFAAMSDEEADRRDRRHRRHRPRGARGQGPPGRHPPPQGPHRGDDRRRRERRAGTQDGRHRRRDGHHRHRGLEGGRGDDPDRRQLRDDRPGRGARACAVRQPVALHPLPDGVPLRLHRHVPRREHLQHPRWRPVPAAADAVDQLHGRHLPGRSASATASRARA